MAINEELECSAGFYHSVLAKDFEEVKGDYGYNPWYAGPKRYGGTLPLLPEKLILMEKITIHMKFARVQSTFMS